MRSHYSYCSSLVADAENSASTTKKSKNSPQLSASEIAFRGTSASASANFTSNNQNHNCSTTEQTSCDYFSYKYHNNTGIEAEKTFHHTQFHHLPPTLIMQQQEQPINTTKIKIRNNTCNNKKIINKSRRNNKTNKLGLLIKFYLNNRSMQIFLPLIIFCVASINAFDINQHQQQRQHLQHSSSSYSILSNGSLRNNISSNNIIYKIPLNNNDQLNLNRDGDVSVNHHKNKNSIGKRRIYEDSANVSQKDSIEDYEDDTESDVNLNIDETIASQHQADPHYSYVHRSTHFSGSCPSCGSHEDLKRVSLEFIKHRVLHKLGLEAPPNMTVYPKLSDLIIQNYLNTSSYIQYMPSKSSTTTTNNYEMIGDDPTPYRDDSYTRDTNEEDEEDANYYSITQRVIALPIKLPKMRHQKRAHQEILQFNFDNNSGISQANLHLYIQGEQWLRKTNPELLRNMGTASEYNNITISIHKIIRSNIKSAENKAYHKEETIYEGKLPQNNGEYVKINVTTLMSEWFRDPSSNHGMLVKTYGQLAQKVVVLDIGELTPFIEYEVDDKRKPRHKRSAHALNCDENDSESRCCRFPLTVDFDEFGWNWIIAPKKYDANYCSGECSLNFLPKYPHTHVWQLSNSASATPCCSPRKMSDLKLLYYDMKFNIVLSKIPNMIVETCSCS